MMRTLPENLRWIHEDAQAKLQATLNRITTDIDRWGQGHWCWIPGGLDYLDDAAMEKADGTADYHGFTLPAEAHKGYRVPVADCGTSFCLAGDVAVSNGYVFVADEGEEVATLVVRENKLAEYFRLGRDAQSETEEVVECVAERLLGLLDVPDGYALFDSSNSLITLWAMAYALTNGEIELPVDGLPEVPHRNRNGNTPSPAVAGDELEGVILTRLHELTDNRYEDIEFVDEWWRATNA